MSDKLQFVGNRQAKAYRTQISAEGAKYVSQGQVRAKRISAKGANYDSQGQVRAKRISGKGANYDSQGQVRAKRSTTPQVQRVRSPEH